jgi:hypothetical protein
MAAHQKCSEGMSQLLQVVVRAQTFDGNAMVFLHLPALNVQHISHLQGIYHCAHFHSFLQKGNTTFVWRSPM